MPVEQVRAIHCGVCGGTRFAAHRVMWDQLVNDWQLSPAEAEYVDRQQGECCTQCGANLRSVALANAIRAFLGTEATLLTAVNSPAFANLQVLEINEAGTLSPILRALPGHVFGAYPQVDMHAMPYESGSFDLVVHSDTLEHVKNPIHALQECRRVLKPGGALCFTVPTIVGRMTRSREGLAKSYHGDPATGADDYVVHTEFGADAWTYAMEAGFTEISIHCAAYPAGIAYLARNRSA